ncbi:amino acid/polyamine transporter I [Gongronella butleri]|nr:amino acid/polyamine transporter I [Gongronella butleri]
MNGDQVINKKRTLTLDKPDISHIESSAVNADADHLKDLGYKQEFTRNLGSVLQVAFPFTAMGVLPNWLVGFGPSLASGGPSSLFWGWIITAPMTLAVAASMAEIYSSYPLNGGFYSFSYYLSSKRWGPLMSWLTGYIYAAATLAANMTVAWNLAQLIIGMASVVRQETIDNLGAYVGIYVLMSIICTACGFAGLRFTNWLNYFMAFWLFANTFVFAISVPLLAPTNNNASWVFTQFTNETGYENLALVFFLGLLQSGWTMVGFDAGITISENTKDASKEGPKGLMTCVILALIQGIALTVAVLFSIQDLDALINSDMPIADFFMQVTQNKHVSAFFLSVMVIAQFGSLSNTSVAFTRICHAMARDGVLPYSRFFYKLHNEVPVRLAVMQIVIMTLVILPIFATDVFWSAILSLGVVAYNMAYALPFVCRLIWVRDKMPKGAFDLGRWSLPLNIISVLWISFLSIILCFPAVSPVDAASMNYSSLMIGAVVLFSLAYYAIKGRKTFHGPRANADDDNDEAVVF